MRILGLLYSGALIVVGRFCGAVWAPHHTLPTNRAGGYYPPLRSIGYKNALVGAAICRPPCPPDCFFQICLRQIWSSLSWFESNSKNKKNGAHKAVYHFGWTSRLRNLLRNSPPDCFFQICLRQIWSSLSWFESNSKNKKNGAHKAVYHFGWTSRLRNLLRNSPPDCFFQICLHQIWSSLSLVRVNK